MEIASMSESQNIIGECQLPNDNVESEGIDADDKAKEESHEQDWDLIMGEVRRNFDLLWDTVKVQVDKAAILLGFSIAVLIQIAVTNDLIYASLPTNFERGGFWLGIVLVFVSTSIGVYLFDVKKYESGAKVEELLEKWYANEDLNFKDNIDGCINRGRTRLEAYSNRYALLLRIQLYLLVIGAGMVIAVGLFGSG